MNRLKKELYNRGIIGDNEIDVILGKSNVEWEAKLFGIHNNLIIIEVYTNVLDNSFQFIDRNFNTIASQAMWLNNMEHWNFGEKNRWDIQVYGCVGNDIDAEFELDV